MTSSTNRIKAFIELGKRCQNLSDSEKETIFDKAYQQNQWFTPQNLNTAFAGLQQYLDESKLKQWLDRYELDKISPRKVGLVMAGNVPMVGFHDLLSVLITGHHAHIKTSKDDNELIQWLVNQLIDIEPEFRAAIHQPQYLKKIDAAIATGSNNTARYFDYYFRDIPHVIRRNRTGVALLNGRESTGQLQQLGQDIFLYFGLGCRNVSKIYVPMGYDFTILFKALEAYQSVVAHHKYRNNYDYHKSILLVNREAHLDTGFLLAQEKEQLVSPLSMIYFAYYDNPEALAQELAQLEDQIQVKVGPALGGLEFGTAQYPELWDYADGVDTIEFLSNLNSQA